LGSKEKTNILFILTKTDPDKEP